MLLFLPPLPELLFQFLSCFCAPPLLLRICMYSTAFDYDYVCFFLPVHDDVFSFSIPPQPLPSSQFSSGGRHSWAMIKFPPASQQMVKRTAQTKCRASPATDDYDRRPHAG